MPPERGETQTGFGPPPPGARRFTQLSKRRSRPRGSVALQACGSAACSAPAPDRIGAGNHQALRGLRRGTTSHWGRQPPIGVGKLPTPMHSFLPQCPGQGPDRTHRTAAPAPGRRGGPEARRRPNLICTGRAPGRGRRPGPTAQQRPPRDADREHPGRSHWLSARTGPPPPPPCRLGLGALDERTVE